jgi:hypothetical protein
MDITLELKKKTDGLREEVKRSFDTFLGHVDAAESALLEAQKLYGANCYVELDFDGDKRGMHCWIWSKYLGGKSIIGSGQTWEHAFDDAASRAEKEAEEDQESE